MAESISTLTMTLEQGLEWAGCSGDACRIFFLEEL